MVVGRIVLIVIDNFEIAIRHPRQSLRSERVLFLQARNVPDICERTGEKRWESCRASSLSLWTWLRYEARHRCAHGAWQRAASVCAQT